MDKHEKNDADIIKNATETVNPLIVKPRLNKEPIVSYYTIDNLKNMTKVEIINLALENSGIELSIRRKKEDLIEEFLLIQRKV